MQIYSFDTDTSYTMVRYKDEIWEHWTVCAPDGSGKLYATCKYCNHKLQSNASRFKQHIVVLCEEAPESVKNKFRQSVASQSIATLHQKANFPVHVTPTSLPSPVSTVNPTLESLDSLPSLQATDEGCISSHGTILTSHFREYTSVAPVAVGLPASVAVEHVAESTSHSHFETDFMPIVTRLQQRDQSSISMPSTSSNNRGLRSFLDVVTPTEKETLDRVWSETMYTNNWSFNGMNNPCLAEFFQRIRPGWQPPSPFQLSHRLLDAASERVQSQISDAMMKSPILTLQLDGWSDVNRASVVNVAVYAGQPIFKKSIHPGLDRHDSNS